MATAKKKQAIPVLPLEVARDAIREGRPVAEVVAATADDATARLQLGLELMRAAMELLAAGGVWHVNTWAHDASASNIRSVEMVARTSVAADIVYLQLSGLGGGPGPADSPPHTAKFPGGTSVRKASITIGGVRVDIRGPEVVQCGRKVNGVQCTGENGHDGDHTFGEQT